MDTVVLRSFETDILAARYAQHALSAGGQVLSIACGGASSAAPWKVFCRFPDEGSLADAEHRHKWDVEGLPV